jgi:hypothetical protein
MKLFAKTLIGIAILNFISFMIASESLGGDAVNGKTDGQNYYVGSHGRYTEVSRSVFDYSRFHTHSVWVTHPLGFIGGLILMWKQKQEKSSHAA